MGRPLFSLEAGSRDLRSNAKGGRRRTAESLLRPGLAAYPLLGRLMFAAGYWLLRPYAGALGTPATDALAARRVAALGIEPKPRPQRRATRQPMAKSIERVWESGLRGRRA